MSRTVHVKNINPNATKDEVKNFFAFCGSVESSVIDSQTGTADVTFAKESSANTAVLLDGTELAGSNLQITLSDTSAPEAAASPGGERSYDNEGEVPQEDKPRRRIIAEYLAHGYSIGDQAIARALELDKAHGISSRFDNWLKSLEEKYKAQERARDLDSKYNVTSQMKKTLDSWGTYFKGHIQSASQTPIGLQLRDFYNGTVQTVKSVHEEAQWIKTKRYSKTCDCQASSDACTCAPGTCACADCPKNIYATTRCCKDGKSDACCEGSEGCQKGYHCCKDESSAKEKCCPEGCCQEGGACEKNQCCKDDGTCEKRKACSCAEGECTCAPKAAKDCGCGTSAAKCPCKQGECACEGCEKNTSN